MKTVKITYWVSTALVALMMTYSGYSYFTEPAIAQGFRHLGFPGYFRIELAIAKLIGSAVLLLPVAARLKEWAYAGFAFTFISAFVAHTAMGDPTANQLGPVLFLVVLLLSYVTYHKWHSSAPVTSKRQSVLQQ
ncbi:DoxX family protein [Spirosoma soli]|uniref:DoxX family protein n=1 Tax=Spirosoma soli TaxID=1770529 RepID=A0ABW5M643_9BACT